MGIGNIFKKKKYLNCPYMKHSLHFFHDEIRACCSNVKGPTFYSNYDGGNVDWNEVYKTRKKFIKQINSVFSDSPIPKECQGCYLADSFLSDERVENFENKINCLFIQNTMSCNAKCIYCVFAEVDKGTKYEVVPLIQSLVDKSLLDKKSKLILSGGEITISPDFDKLVDLLAENVDSPIFLATSGIKYSKSVENAFEKEKCWQTISLDAGTPETYKTLKKVDCFETIINNLKNYIAVTEKAKRFIILKYILIDDVNDNLDEISKFFDVVKGLGIENVSLNVNFEEYSFTNEKVVPKHYFELVEKFKELANQNNIKFCEDPQTEAILKKENV